MSGVFFLVFALTSVHRFLHVYIAQALIYVHIHWIALHHFVYLCCD